MKKLLRKIAQLRQIAARTWELIHFIFVELNEEDNEEERD